MVEQQEEIKTKEVEELESPKELKQEEIKKVEEKIKPKEIKRYMGKQIDAKLLPKNEEGLTCCRWCGMGVKPPKRTMCSKECVHELKLRIILIFIQTYI